jgi:AraC-like DNA-binding protein
MIVVPEHLRDRIASISFSHEIDSSHTVIPGTQAVLGFQLRGRIRNGEDLLSRAGVTGLLPTARSYQYVGETLSVLVRFTAQGASCLGVPASELAGQSIPLDALLSPSAVKELQERAQETPEQAPLLIASFLGQLPHARDWLISKAITLLESLPEGVSISSVARHLELSERQLERRFLQRVGVTPKKYMMLHRFERAASQLANTPLSSAAVESGYYDQSHLIREFRRFTGVTPTQYLQSLRR